MEAVEIIVLLVGIGMPLVLLLVPGSVNRPKSPPPKTKSRPDLVDDMVLWGEVNNDGDYRL